MQDGTQKYGASTKKCGRSIETGVDRRRRTSGSPVAATTIEIMGLSHAVGVKWQAGGRNGSTTRGRDRCPSFRYHDAGNEWARACRKADRTTTFSQSNSHVGVFSSASRFTSRLEIRSETIQAGDHQESDRNQLVTTFSLTCAASPAVSQFHVSDQAHGSLR